MGETEEVMQFEKDRNNDREKLTQLANVLIEALPWVKNVTGKTMVIKYGGAAMVDRELRAQVMSDIVMLKIMGVNPILVHGGGKDIDRMLGRLGMEPRFVDGLRVTDEATMEIVEEVLIGKVNLELVGSMNRHGAIAVGLSGAEASTVVAEPYDDAHGLTGRVTKVNTEYLQDLVDKDYIPIVASIAVSEDKRTFYNVNADSVAGAVAAAIGAHKVIFLSDVDGLYLDFEDKGSLISRLTVSEAKELAASGKLSSGMIPKIDAVVQALDAGVPRAHMLNGTVPHAILLEMLTDKGVGTMVTQDCADAHADFETRPLMNFAAKLQE